MAPGDDAPEIGVGLQNGTEHAERAATVNRGRRHVEKHVIKQRCHRGLRTLYAGRHPALLGGAIEHREIELLLGGVECGKQVEHLARDDRGTGVGAIHLIDRDNRP